jgi:hypothetical protein
MISNGSHQYGQPLFVDRLDALGTARIMDRVTLSPTGGDDLAYAEGWLQALVVYGRFCKSAGEAGSWYAGDVDVT